MKLIVFIHPPSFGARFDKKSRLVDIGFEIVMVDEESGQEVYKTVFGREQVLCVSDTAVEIKTHVNPEQHDIFIVSDDHSFTDPIGNLGRFCVLHHTLTKRKYAGTLETLRTWPDFLNIESSTEDSLDGNGRPTLYLRLARLIEAKQRSTAEFISLVSGVEQKYMNAKRELRNTCQTPTGAREADITFLHPIDKSAVNPIVKKLATLKNAGSLEYKKLFDELTKVLGI